MPIYEYICDDCQREIELIRPISQADGQLTCEACGGVHMTRKLTLCYAHSGGHAIAGTTPPSSCSGCTGGSCSSCGH